MQQILKQPILYMILLGIVLFAVYTNISNFYDTRDRQIIVGSEQIGLITETFTKTWNRSPTESELQGLIDAHIKEEIYYREAVALGLDRSDPAVKRRLRQMMELMLDDNTEVYPSEDQLRDFLNQNPEKFTPDATISFQQIYFKPEREQAAREALQEIKIRPGNQEIGDAIMIPREFQNETSFRIRNTFGEEFSSAIFNLQAGDWQGPLQSAYGWHLVRISNLTKAQVPDLNDVWDEVEKEWSFQKKQELKEAQYQEIMDRYIITVESTN